MNILSKVWPGARIGITQKQFSKSVAEVWARRKGKGIDSMQCNMELWIRALIWSSWSCLMTTNWTCLALLRWHNQMMVAFGTSWCPREPHRRGQQESRLEDGSERRRYCKLRFVNGAGVALVEHQPRSTEAENRDQFSKSRLQVWDHHKVEGPPLKITQTFTRSVVPAAKS